MILSALQFPGAENVSGYLLFVFYCGICYYLERVTPPQCGRGLKVKVIKIRKWVKLWLN